MIDPTDLLLARPQLRTTGRLVRLSTDSLPTVDDDGGALQVGTELLHEDTGAFRYWTGSEWLRSNLPQKLDQLIDVAIEIRDLLQTALEDES